MPTPQQRQAAEPPAAPAAPSAAAEQEVAPEMRVVRHPILGEVEVPASLSDEDVQHELMMRQIEARRIVRRQMDYYFSDQNYPRDKFLQSLEDDEHCKIAIVVPRTYGCACLGIPLHCVSKFNRIRAICSSIEVRHVVLYGGAGSLSVCSS